MFKAKSTNTTEEGFAWGVFCLASFAVGWGLLLVLGFRALDAAEIRYAEIPLDVAHEFEARLGKFEEPGSREAFEIAFLGDSTAGGFGQAHSIPRLVERFANAELGGRPDVRVHHLAAPGLGAFDYYFLAELVIEAQPDQAIFLTNLSSFSDSFTNTFRRPDLAALIPPSRVPEALALPLYRVGVTTDVLAIDLLLGQVGALDAWRNLRREQARVNRAVLKLKNHIDLAIGGGHEEAWVLDRMDHFSGIFNLPGGNRLSSAGLEDRYGEAMAGVPDEHPSLAMLRAAVGAYQRAGIPTLIYVNPTNVEHMRFVDPLNAEGLALSLARIAALADELGSEFADLHAIFPDDHFRDPAGHFTTDKPDARLKLGRALAPYVVRAARAVEAGD